MDRAARAIAGQIASCSVSITMPWPANAASPCSSTGMIMVVNLFARFLLAVAKIVLLAAGHAFDDRIDKFQMARVARKLDA